MFKTIDRAVDENCQVNSELVAQIKSLEESRALPVTNQLVSYKGSEGKINAKNHSMGPERAKALAKALHLTDCYKVNLRFNRLDPYSGKLILESINPKISDLNLEKNSLGKDNSFSNALIEHLGRHDTNLRHLNLSENGFSDQ